MFGCFRGPDWHDSIKHPSTPAIDETSADHPSVILSGGLEASTDDGPPCPKTDRLDAAITITERTADETSDKSTEVVYGDNATLEKSVIDHWSTGDWICVAKFHGVVIIVGCCVDTAHHTLIISEEEDGQAGDAVDGC